MISSLQAVKYSGICLREDLDLLRPDPNHQPNDNPTVLLNLIKSIQQSIKGSHSPSKSKKRKRGEEYTETLISSSPHKQQSRIAPNGRMVRLILEDLLCMPIGSKVVVATKRNKSALWGIIKKDIGDASKVRLSRRQRGQMFEAKAELISTSHLPTNLDPDSFSFFKHVNKSNNSIIPHIFLQLFGGKEVVITLPEFIRLEVEVWAEVNEFYATRRFADALLRKSYLLCARAAKRYHEEVMGCFVQSNELVVPLFRSLRYIENWNRSKDESTAQSPLANVDCNVVSPPEDTVSAGEIPLSILRQLDLPWEQALRGLYGCWIEGGDHPIFTESEKDGLLAQFETLLPHHARNAYDLVLTARQRQPKGIEKQALLIKEKKLQAYYSVLANCRVKNRFCLKYFAIANTLRHASKGTKEMDLRVQVKHGYAMSYTAAFNTLDEIAIEGMEKIKPLLRQESMLLSSIDNFQEFVSRKFQRNALSVSAKHGTTEYLARARRTAPPCGSKLRVRGQDVVVKEILEEGPFHSSLIVCHDKEESEFDVIDYPDKDVIVVEVEGAQPRPELVYIEQKSPIPLGFSDLPPLFDDQSDMMLLDEVHGEEDDPQSPRDLPALFDGQSDMMLLDEVDGKEDHQSPRVLFTDYPEIQNHDNDVADHVMDATDDERFQWTQVGPAATEDDERSTGNVESSSNERSTGEGAGSTDTHNSDIFTVEDYAEQHQLSKIIGVLFRYSGNSFRSGSSEEECIRSFVQGNRNLVLSAKSYQRRVMQRYNPYIEDVTQLLMLPLSIFDEISTVGCATVIFEWLERIGLASFIKNDSGSSINAERTKENVHVHLTVDYLTAKNVRCIEMNLVKKLTQPGSEAFVLGCLDCLKPVTVHQAPFHAMMHMVDAIQRLFYPGLIQVVQSILGWKRIRYDPIPRLQMTVALHDKIHEELTRVYVEDWAANLAKRGALSDDTGNPSIPLSDLKQMDAEDALVSLAKDFLAFLNPFHHGTTNDQRANCLGQFHYWTMLRRQYSDAIREGDPFTMEYQNVKWLEMFAVSGKPNYVESVLCSMETLVALSPLDLEDLRKNVCIRLHNDRRMVAFDEFIEMLNDQLKKFLNSKTIEGVSAKSLHVQSGVAAYKSLEPSAGRMKSSTEPRDLRERKAMYKFFRDLQPTKVRGDILDDNGFWHLFEKHKLSSESDERLTQPENESLARLRDLFSKVSKKAATPVSDSDFGHENSADDESGNGDGTGANADGAVFENGAEDDEEHSSILNMKKYSLNPLCGKPIHAKALSLLGDIKAKRSEKRKAERKEKELVEAIVRDCTTQDQLHGCQALIDSLDFSNSQEVEDWEAPWQAPARQAPL